MDAFAGIVSGLLLGTVFLGVAIFTLASRRDIYDRLSKRLPQGFSPTVILLAIVTVTPILLGLIGGIAGVLYNVAEDASPNAGLGSSSFVFTLAILIVSVLLTIVFFLIQKKPAWLGFIMIAAFAGIFGWILPLLADWR